MTENKPKLDQIKVTLLNDIMDVLVPKIDDIPGAGSLGLGKDILELTNKYERYRNALFTFMDAMSLDPRYRANGGFSGLKISQQEESLRSLEEYIPKTFETVLEMVYLSYYSNPQVQTRIGLGKPNPQPDGWVFPPFSTKILDKIKSRKPFWKNIEST